MSAKNAKEFAAIVGQIQYIDYDQSLRQLSKQLDRLEVNHKVMTGSHGLVHRRTIHGLLLRNQKHEIVKKREKIIAKFSHNILFICCQAVVQGIRYKIK